MVAVLFEGNSHLGAVLVELVDTEILLHGSYDIVFYHEIPASVKLNRRYDTSAS